MDADYHVHSSYSDGRHLPWMIGAAVEAGLDGIGFADHANVSARESMRESKLEFAFNLDITFDRRREAITRLRDEYDIEIYDAVEMDYHPADEAEIESFLAEADFDYTIGSVHEVNGFNVHFPSPYEDETAAKKRAAVDQYFDRLEALIESELFDVAAHPDIIERNAELRGIPETEDYHRIAAAFVESRTVPEINAGRIDQDYGRFHPRTEFLDILLEYDVEVTVGSDSHKPDAIRERVPSIEAMLEDRGLTPVSPQ